LLDLQGELLEGAAFKQKILNLVKQGRPIIHVICYSMANLAPFS